MLKRATDLADLRARLERFRSPASLQAGLGYRARPGDVFIATYPKCGTTWVQQIVHALRTRGSMDFDEITRVVPWLESALDLGLDPQAPQCAAPRAFKTHLDGDAVPRGGRYIYVVRNPEDALLSMYRFFAGWFFEPDSIGLEEFALDFYLGSGSASGLYWDHLLSWWPSRARKDTLFLAYESMLAAPRASIERIARFVGIAADSALLDLVQERASLGFMQRHAAQFDDHLVRAARNAACGLPPGGATGKVRHATADADGVRLGERAREALAERWRAQITGATGLADYAALARALRVHD